MPTSSTAGVHCTLIALVLPAVATTPSGVDGAWWSANGATSDCTTYRDAVHEPTGVSVTVTLRCPAVSAAGRVNVSSSQRWLLLLSGSSQVPAGFPSTLTVACCAAA